MGAATVLEHRNLVGIAPAGAFLHQVVHITLQIIAGQHAGLQRNANFTDVLDG